jgi:adenylosuccinate lyase
MNRRLNELVAISALDGRYWQDVNEVSKYFSDYALIRGRVMVEIEYLIALSEAGITDPFSDSQKGALRNVYKGFTYTDARRVNALEKETDHDVQAIVYFLREKGVLTDHRKEEVHLGLTSEDPTNIAYSVAWMQATNDLYLPALTEVEEKLEEMAGTYKDVPMLGRTHGRPASPTTVGKEMANFGYRLRDAKRAVGRVQMAGKLNGAVGNYNALVAAYPYVDWIGFTQKFVEGFELEPYFFTTQILPHDRISRLMREIVGVNQMMLDLDQDMWHYISDDWFLQHAKAGQTGSSTMPQKINPRFFENSEGNLKMANWIFTGMADELQKSRLQRDLSDSTIKRNYGVPLAHTLLAYQMALRNLDRVYTGTQYTSQALLDHPEIISEAIQTVLKRAGVRGAYEMMRDFTRGKEVTLENLHAFVDELDISQEVKDEIREITPLTYLGNAARLAEAFANREL